MMGSIAFLAFCILLLALFVVTKFRVVPFASRMFHGLTNIRVSENGEIKIVSGSGYEVEATMKIAEFIRNAAPGCPFALIPRGGHIYIIILEQDEARRGQFQSIINSKTPNEPWREVDKNQLRRKLWIP